MTTPPAPLDLPELALLEAGVGHVLAWMPGVAYIEAEEVDGRTHYLSPRIVTLTGHPPERFTSSPAFWYELIHPDDRQRLHEADADAELTHEPYRQEYRLRTADGREVWVRDEAVFVPAEGGRPAHWIGLIVDVTKEKEAEARAAEAERRYRTLVEQLPIVTYIDAPDESLANLYVSPQVSELLGRPSGPTGEEWAERVHPEDRERARLETI
jgi:PAS domain S-box-containing protein